MADKKKKKKYVGTRGRIYVKCSFNNTIITATDEKGDVIAWASGGTVGFKGARKSTPYAAQLAAEKVSKEILDRGVKEVEIYIKGAGGGRETAIRAIANTGLKIVAIKDVTPIPHNGCRPRKKRRV